MGEEHKFNEGDVVILSGPKLGEEKSFVSGWRFILGNYIGREAVITDSFRWGSGGPLAYEVDVDGVHWLWDESYMKPADVKDDGFDNVF